jgi:ABC-type lipoprotein export system ATPase subunit
MTTTTTTPVTSNRGGLAVHCAGVAHVYASPEGESIIALRNVDLHVDAGETVALLGPSGSGKSTLLSLLAGLIRPTTGKVRIGEKDLSQLNDRQLGALRAADVGIVLQNPVRNLLVYGTAAQNVAFAQRGTRGRRRSTPLVVPELLKALEIEDLAHRTVAWLSGGQQQRVAVATGLANGPGLLLVDEPTSHLGQRARQAAVDTLLTANRRLGTTIIVVTHDPVVAGAFPRTITIRAGQTGAEGRAGRDFAVMGEGGMIQLPGPIIDTYPPGTLLEVTQDSTGVHLHQPHVDAQGDPS